MLCTNGTVADGGVEAVTMWHAFTMLVTLLSEYRHPGDHSFALFCS
jgi:hypothetical protein